MYIFMEKENVHTCICSSTITYLTKHGTVLSKKMSLKVAEGANIDITLFSFLLS